MFGLYPDSFNEIINILKELNSIEKVIIYGSRAKGTHKEGSDVDITILGNITDEDYNKFWQKLDDSYIPYKFDISIFNNLKSKELIEHINRVGKVFYEKENT
ncbi:nucleotidyltransferase domain-containing protein [Flavobacterium sp. RSB2_4_14]|uniref:nucleotidyltransferase domain-containing protein n=1 Tax=Flavobacterium sp. RSB2_4_14 TaxID=3447665 RepID=UPI003F35BAEA